MTTPDRDHLGTRRHDLAHDLVAQIDDRLDHAALVPFEDALVLADSDAIEAAAL